MAEPWCGLGAPGGDVFDSSAENAEKHEKPFKPFKAVAALHSPIHSSQAWGSTTALSAALSTFLVLAAPPVQLVTAGATLCGEHIY